MEITQTKKPIAKVIGRDSNVFTTLGICTQALKDAVQPDKADELTGKIFDSGSYHEALAIMRQYCTLK